MELNEVLARVLSGQSNPISKPDRPQPKEEWQKYAGPWRGQPKEINHEIVRALG